MVFSLGKNSVITALLFAIAAVGLFAFFSPQTVNAQVCGQNYYYTVYQANCVWNSGYGEYTCPKTAITVGGYCAIGQPPYDPQACATPQQYYADVCSITNEGQNCATYPNYHPGSLCYQSGGGGGCNYEKPSCGVNYSSYPTVNYGESSAYVEILQNALMTVPANQGGYNLCPYGGSDGYYGGGTANAVYNFKTFWGLGTDPNRFGSSAWNTIDNLVNAQTCQSTTYWLRMRSSRYLSNGSSEGISGVYVQTCLGSGYTSGSLNFSTTIKQQCYISAPTTITYSGSKYNFVKWVIEENGNEKLSAYSSVSINDTIPTKTARAYYELAPKCSDLVDNDGDGATDYPNDFSCLSVDDNGEANPKSQCQDGIDNDGNGKTDYPTDSTGCSSYQDNSEYTPQCGDGIDNDGDGAADYPNDFSCSSSSDTDETNPRAQCQDGADNDGDGLTDYPADSGCANYQDNDEYVAQCNDGVDNADPEDTIADYPADPGCSGYSDNDETDITQCNDGVDNADPEDTIADYPADPGCTSYQDDDETDVIPGSSGTLISSTFDTGLSDGVQINSVIWQGSLGVGDTSVQFQIASANCSNGATDAPTCTSNVGWGVSKTEGDGAFIGPSGTSIDWYDSLPNSPAVVLTNQHTNKRYFRYTVKLYKAGGATSPVVDDIIINWSP